eukprot:c25368_g1_i1.p1 GENE.c25368_g1_i1~~c25368_g1_i1.p1  ORF type:complete len:912 (-),score=266.71 c25368_g1_i1:40-2775(-)
MGALFPDKQMADTADHTLQLIDNLLGRLSGSSHDHASEAAPKSAEPVLKIGDVEFGEVVEKHAHPPWYRPANGVDVGLRVHNTLTEPQRKGRPLPSDLEPFVPGNGRRVLWYTCGPTVYDSCHMGHARAYLTFDILRRIIEDYFGYEVMYHVNITDIDDKIILRARRNKLIADYTAAAPTSEAERFKLYLKDIGEQFRVKAERLVAKSKQLEQPLDANATSRDREAHETKKEEHELKSRQFVVTQRRIEAIKLASDKGVAAAEAQVLSDANKSGLVKAANIGELAEALENAIIDVQTLLEKARDAAENDQIAALSKQANVLDEVQACLGSVELCRSQGCSQALLAAGKDELGEKLDEEKGDTVTDHEVFNKHARHYEREYMEDMATLGVREPTVLTRVTEYVDKIIDFIQVIVNKGLAYETSGNVYLDTEGFKRHGHHYKKLKPSQGDTSDEGMAESEGALGAAGTKKHKNDFALWKSSKRGEPEWNSPWGKGRPGWHIECSVVAGDILGENIDVHAGGVDLKFPHHDNELAQSEACYGHPQWVNYFFHAGHLNIKGLKMSKSLKNFITIRQALKQHTPRQLRLMFLLQPWDREMNYSDQTVGDARKKETTFKNYFGTIKAILRQDWLLQPVGWAQREDDRELSRKGIEMQSKVHAALSNNFDTEGAILAMCDLISDTNKYLERQPVCHSMLRSHAVYMTRILTILGVADGSDDIGFSDAGGAGDKESLVAPFLDCLLAFRNQVRTEALKIKASAPEVLTACDGLRSQLVDLGVRLEDSVDGGASRWKLDDPETLRREVLEKATREAEAKRQKQQKNLARKQEELAKAIEARAPPKELFAGTQEYRTFDETGLPLTDADGKDLPKSATKKLKKLQEAQAKAHEKLVEKSNGDVEGYIAALQKEVADLLADA